MDDSVDAPRINGHTALYLSDGDSSKFVIFGGMDSERDAIINDAFEL